MPRPVRELWNSLGARPGDDVDLLVVGADALSLDSVFGGELDGDIVVRLFSEEAFGFSAPDELAALGVFWAPHLENGKQLRAAVTDAQDRLKRKVEGETALLTKLGFRTRLAPPHPAPRGSADIGGHSLEVRVGEGGELLLERVDGGAVPDGEREVLRELGDARRDDVHDALAERAHHLVEEGLVEPASLEPPDDGGFDEDNRTAQLPAADLRGVDPGTELVPPPSDDDDVEDDGGADDAAADDAADDAAADDAGEAARGGDDDGEPDLAAVLAEEDLALSQDGAPVEAAAGPSLDDEEHEEDEANRTAASDDFADLRAVPTEQMSVLPGGDPEVNERLSQLARGFDDDTGEEAALLSLSGDDGVMPSPAEATQLRPAPTSAELGLSDAEEGLATPPLGRAPAAGADDEEDEETVARAPQFRTGRKGPSLVSSGSAGSSAPEEQAAALDDDEGEPAPPLADDEEPEDASDEARAPSIEALERLEAEPTDPRGLHQRALEPDEPELSSSLDVEVEAELPASEEAPGDAALEASGFQTGEFPKGAREAAAATALASLADDRAEEQTEAEASFSVPSRERLDALAAIVGEGMSSGKTGAIVLDADAFAYLRDAAGEPATGEDPDALEREAELLELKARELRAKAELLRERATAPVSRRKLASALEKARAARDEEERAAASAESVPSDEAAGAFASEPSVSSEDAFASSPAERPTSGEHVPDVEDGEDQAAAEVDAFADGVALEEVRAMLAAESGGDVYAATQLAEMDLGELRQPSHSGGVFEDGAEDESPAYELDDNTGRGAAYRTSMASLPQAASADVEVLESRLERSSEPVRPAAAPSATPASGPATRAPASSKKQPAAARALALVVNDPRARERLKKHLEEVFPRVVELASPREAATLSVKDVQAVVIVRPVHDEATVSGLQALDGSRGRPPVLVLSSDASFDGLPGVDLRLTLGRRASEVAKQVLEGLTTLGVRASA